MTTTFDPKTNQITDGTYTMTFDITMLPAPLFTSPTVKIDPFGEGSISKKVPAEKVPALIARIETEVFPQFVAYKQAKEQGNLDAAYKIHNQINNIRWGF